MKRVIAALAIVLMLAGGAYAISAAFTLQGDGWHAPSKDPGALLDYSIDWSKWLGTDTLQTSVWTYSPGIVGANEAQSATATTTWLSEGTVGQTYTLTNRVTTAGGRTQLQSFKITIKAK